MISGPIVAAIAGLSLIVTGAIRSGPDAASLNLATA